MEWKEVKISGGTLSFIMGITASLDESPYSQSVAKNDVPRFLKEHEHENGIGDWNLSIDFNNHGYGFPGDALINWTITVTESFYDATIIDER